MENVKCISAKGGRNSEKKSAATNCAGINYVSMPRELELHDDKSCHKLFPCKEAMETLIYGIADWVEVSTFLTIVDLMRGLNDKLAVKVAGFIEIFCIGGGRYLTGIEHIDSALLHIYKSIYEQAKAKGKKLELPCR